MAVHGLRLLSSSPQLAKKYDYNDFEAQCMLEVKVKLVMQQLQHILNEVRSIFWITRSLGLE